MHKYYDLQPNAIQNKLISEFPSFHSFMNACLEQNHSLHSLAIDSFSSSGHDHFNKGYKYYFDSINSINNNKAKFVFIGLFEEFDEEAQRLFRTLGVRNRHPKKLNTRVAKNHIIRDVGLRNSFAKSVLADEYEIYNCLLKIRDEQF